MTEKTRIQKTIIETVRAGDFFEVTYDTATNIPVELDPETATVVVPTSVFCNETESQIVLDKDYGLDQRLKRGTWIFECLVSWNCEVTLEAFIKSLLEDIPYLVKTDALRSCSIYLLNYVVSHPVVTQNTTGTDAKLTFNVKLSRN